MGASNSEKKNLRFYNLKAKVDAQNDPFFGVSEKINDKWETTNKFDTMTGRLVRAEIREKEYDGAKQNVFYITLNDGKEESVIQMTHNQISYSIISSLLSLDSFNKDLLIRLYKTSSQSNGKTYWNGHAFMELGMDKVSWSVNPKDAPKPEQVFKADGEPFLVNGKPTYDSTKKKLFYEEHFKTLIEKLKNSPTDIKTEQQQSAEDFINDINQPVEREIDSEEDPF